MGQRPFAIGYACSLARLLGILRSDREFLHAYDARLDTLLAEHGIAIRDEHGYLADPPQPLELAKAMGIYEAVAHTMQENSRTARFQHFSALDLVPGATRWATSQSENSVQNLPLIDRQNSRRRCKCFLLNELISAASTQGRCVGF